MKPYVTSVPKIFVISSLNDRRFQSIEPEIVEICKFPQLVRICKVKFLHLWCQNWNDTPDNIREKESSARFRTGFESIF